MKWSHRPTWPKVPDTHATDRLVICDGARVARVTFQIGGPQDRLWRWASGWNGMVTGTCDSLDEALTEVRDAVVRELEQNPDLLAELIDKERISRATLNHWLRAKGREDEIEGDDN